jgi:hypothetical protein
MPEFIYPDLKVESLLLSSRIRSAALEKEGDSYTSRTVKISTQKYQQGGAY